MTDEISGKPRVPVGELKALVESFGEYGENNVRKGNNEGGFYDGIAVGRIRSAHELEALIERYDYE